jgi:single-stranded-DNA-specific exonuclease
MQEAGNRYRWKPADQTPETTDRLAGELVRSLGVPPLVAKVLAQRTPGALEGADAHEAARRFLSPKLTDLHDPALLPGASDAAKRLIRAVADNQPIVIYGDYDVDGVTASAVLWHTFKLADADVYTYIPHRLDEGYGLNSEAIESIAREHGSKPLIISVDCGITATEPAQVAKELGVDLIITDHHEFDPNDLPDAHTLVHPSLPTTNHQSPTTTTYPCPHLCGAGVAFKVAWQFARELCGSNRLPDKYRELMIELLSLVALGTVADVVPLTDENRVLTAFGLSRIKQARFTGLSALIDSSKLRDEKIDAYHVGFVLGPRLNACGRMGHAQDALELLTTAEGARATKLARFLNSENDDRRATERRITEQAKQIIEDHGYATPDRRAIVVGGEGWHPGVVGIVASRLVDTYGRPAVVLGFNNGVAQGSARSIDGVSIHDALNACSEYMDKFGGHAMAAGLTLPVDRVEGFREALIEQVNDVLTEDGLTRRVRVDAEVRAGDCTLEVFDQLGKLAPFGRGNPTPRLLLRDAVLDRPAQRMGSAGAHLSMSFAHNGRSMRAVAFGQGEHAAQLPAGVTVDLLFEPKVNTWQGVRRPELHVTDFKIHTAVTI